MLQGVSELRADVPPESNPPESLQPSAWGTIVHTALEHLHTGEQELERYLDSRSPVVEQRLRDDIIPNYRSTNTWDAVQSTAEEVLPEYELESILAQGSAELYLSGKIDLLYRTSEGWHIVDYKTGALPDEDDYLYDDYRYQLTAYAWLLQDAFNIIVESATLLFVSPTVEEVELDIDLEGFISRIKELPDTLSLDSAEGLAANPDPHPETTSSLSPYSRCGSCAYRDLCPEWREGD
jgi:CRISPR/Cas system-associated exonuclease Cas4 (RecB family)